MVAGVPGPTLNLECGNRCCNDSKRQKNCITSFPRSKGQGNDGGFPDHKPVTNNHAKLRNPKSHKAKLKLQLIQCLLEFYARDLSQKTEVTWSFGLWGDSEASSFGRNNLMFFARRWLQDKLYGIPWCVPMNYGTINANDEFQENFLITPAAWDLASTHISFEAVGTDRQGFATDSYETGGLSTNGEDFFEAIASFVGALAELCVAQPVLFEGPSASTSVTSVRPPFQVHSFEEWKESSQSMVSMNTDITSAFGLIEEKKSGEMFPFLRDGPWVHGLSYWNHL